MTRRAGMCAALLGVAIVATGCDRRELAGPPELRPGRDECAECGMLIHDERCAGAFLLEEDGRGEHLLFDDIGCMLDHELVAPSEKRILGRYACDYSTREWVGSEEAVFLQSAGDRLHTPMGSGIVAYADRSAAERGVTELGGELTTYAALLDVRRAQHTDRTGAP